MDQLKNKAKGAQGQLDNTAGSAKGAGAAAAFLGKASKGAVPGVAALGTALKAALGPIAVLTTAAGALTSAFSTLAQQDFAEAKVRSLGVDSEKLTKQLAGVSRELAGQASVTELTSAAYDVASAGFTDAAAAANILKAASQGLRADLVTSTRLADATTSVERLRHWIGRQGGEAGGWLYPDAERRQNCHRSICGQHRQGGPRGGCPGCAAWRSTPQWPRSPLAVKAQRSRSLHLKLLLQRLLRARLAKSSKPLE